MKDILTCGVCGDTFTCNGRDCVYKSRSYMCLCDLCGSIYWKNMTLDMINYNIDKYLLLKGRESHCRTSNTYNKSKEELFKMVIVRCL